MKIHHGLSILILAAASVAACAQDLKNAPEGKPQPTPDPGMKTPQQAPQAKPLNTPGAGQQSSTNSPTPNRANAYYHFQLGHMYEEMVAMTGRVEFANQAIEEYRKALESDPSSPYLNSALAELYAKTGRIRDAVTEAEEIIHRDPTNVDARRLLGRIYLRSLGDTQSGQQSKTLLNLAIQQYQEIVKLDPTSVEDHLLLGRLYRLNNDLAKSEQEFKTAVQQQPNSEEAVTTLALLYNEEGDNARALNVLEAVPEKARTGKIYAGLGYTYEQKKDYKNAIAAYRKAVDMDHDNLDAVRGLAQNLLNDNQTQAALEQYQAVIQADPQDAETYRRIADIYRRDGKYDQALDALKKAQAVLPDSQEVPYTMAMVYEAMGRYDDAIQILNDLLRRSEKEATTSSAERNNRSVFLERMGAIYREQQKTDKAVETFRRMIPLGDDSAKRAYSQIIETYRDARMWPQATQVAQEAVKQLPKDRDLQLVLASQEADNGQADAAIARVHGMLDGKPQDDREVWTALAQMYSRLKRWKDAEDSIQKATELASKPEEKDYVNFLAGSIYERQKKYEQAEESFRKVIASDPRNASALNYLGYMLADRGTRLEEALSLIKRAVSIEPQNYAYLDSLGWAYFKLGRYDQAEENLRKALEHSDSDPTVHEHMGDLYQKTGRLKQAVSHWERALEEWKKTVPAEVDSNDVAKVQKKLESGRVKLARDEGAAAAK
ncbi:MAG TPA: tetratricopeptide repeat protein [Terriglobales bacterium]